MPQGAAFPYVTNGADMARDWSAVGISGAETTLLLHVWSRERGRKKVKQILAEVRRIRHGAGLAAAGDALVSICREQSRSLLDMDRLTYHGITQFRAVTREL